MHFGTIEVTFIYLWFILLCVNIAKVPNITPLIVAPETHQIRHNDMHFRDVPPYLADLTTTEMALISKISVITNK